MLKKLSPIIFIIFCGLVLSGCSLGKNKNSQDATPTVKPNPKAVKSIEKSVKERPFVSLTPTTDGHRLTIRIRNISPQVKSLEYELIYFADFEGNKIERGLDTGGRPVFLEGKTEFSKEILFGSESCTTGKCKYRYDEGVSEGTLTLKFNYEEGVDKYMSSFRLQTGKQAAEGLSTGDGTFLLKPAVKLNGYYLTLSTAGIPANLDKDPVGLPYSVFPTISSKGIVSFKSDTTDANIYAYDGKVWKQLETKIDGGTLTANTSGEQTFILVK